jgi:Cu/Ag efflux pump CusA
MRQLRKSGRLGTDWRTVWYSTREVGERLIWLILLPFRVVGAVWSLAIAVGVGIVRFSVNFCAAMLGIIFVLFVGYCMARALLYPLF